MSALESIRETSRMISEILSPIGDGDFTLISVLHAAEGSGAYATTDLLCDKEDVFFLNSPHGMIEVMCRALTDMEGGHTLLCRPGRDGEPDVPHVRGWRLLAGEVIPLSSGEMQSLHSQNLGLTDALPVKAIGCMDAYPIILQEKEK